MDTLLLFILMLMSVLDNTHCYITYIVVPQPLKGTQSPPGSPWPEPKRTNRDESRLFSLHPDSFRIEKDYEGVCDIVDEAVQRYETIFFARPFNVAVDDPDPNLDSVQKLTILMRERGCEEKYPSLTSDESYELIVDSPSSTLKANSAWGVLRGLETFSQLIYLKDEWKFVVNQNHIEDEPRFRHRGVLLDTARHFQPLSILFANLDAMAYNKFNVLHWHIVDDQSFPIVLEGLPEMAEKGAYSRRHVYEPEDVQKVIEYARLRGIRVIPEFDTPGHTDSWSKSHPDLVTPCWADGKPFTANYTFHGVAEIINPMPRSTYDFMTTLFNEVYKVFPDPYVHLGMDEVYYDCWRSNPDIAKFMEAQGMGDDYDKLQQYYSNELLKSIKNDDKKFVVWQDVVDNNVVLDKSRVAIEVWQDTSLWNIYPAWTDTTANLTREGYETILSACWYLNIISYGQDWKKYYDCDPHDFEGTEEQKRRVLGGEASLWAEYADGSNILQRLWPRASAVAERLWSPRHKTNSTDDAQFRLDQMRCNLIRRGIPAQPILNGYCGPYEFGMDGVGPSNVLDVTIDKAAPRPVKLRSSAPVSTSGIVTIVYCIFLIFGLIFC